MNWFLLAIVLLYWGAGVHEARQRHYAIAIVYSCYGFATLALMFVKEASK